jgi:hypothetical protein
MSTHVSAAASKIKSFYRGGRRGSRSRSNYLKAFTAKDAKEREGNPRALLLLFLGDLRGLRGQSSLVFPLRASAPSAVKL